ncbi:MAG TPA: UvrB/UvrC motif-containing protein [Abditibacteriaceae bacterium]|jgi:protein-arginine kinase activator protein McsA
MTTLCDLCHNRTATVFLTKIVNNESTKQNLCENCARETASSAIGFEGGAGSLDEIMKSLFKQASAPNWGKDAPDIPGEEDFAEDEEWVPQSDWELTVGQFPADEEFLEAAKAMAAEIFAAAEEEQAEEEDNIEFDTDALPEMSENEDDTETTFGEDFDFDQMLREARKSSDKPEVFSKRCPKCEMTWDRLRQDGRAGCAQCYGAFAEELKGVMDKVQRGPEHLGKAPRAATKRQRRLEHLRARRDHRLEMLNRRLQESIAAERYEEAAKLRDQIKVVSSTIVAEET